MGRHLFKAPTSPRDVTVTNRRAYWRENPRSGCGYGVFFPRILWYGVSTIPRSLARNVRGTFLHQRLNDVQLIVAVYHCGGAFVNVKTDKIQNQFPATFLMFKNKAAAGGCSQNGTAAGRQRRLQVDLRLFPGGVRQQRLHLAEKGLHLFRTAAGVQCGV